MSTIKILLLTLLITTQAWGFLRSQRHRMTRNVNNPDDPRFSLRVLADQFYALLENRGSCFGRRFCRDGPRRFGPPGQPGASSRDGFSGQPGSPGQPGRPGPPSPPPVTPAEAGVIAAVGFGIDGAFGTDIDGVETRTVGVPSPGRPGPAGSSGGDGQPGSPGLAGPPGSPGSQGFGFRLRFLRNSFKIRPRCRQNSRFRTIIGTCNNIRSPRRGAAKIPLLRIVRKNTYEDGRNTPTRTYFSSRGDLPSARVISRTVHMSTSNMSVEHSHLMMGYGQFLDHDLTISPEAGGEGGVVEEAERCCEVSPQSFVGDLRECFPITIDARNPAEPFTRTCIPFLRSAPVPPPPSDRGQVVRYQLNDLTAYVDGSNIYGSTFIKAFALRTFVDGKLKTSRGRNGEELLPPAPNNPLRCTAVQDECRFFGGDVRNSEQAGLSSIHTIFVREHNRIAGELKRLGSVPRGRRGDRRIYEITRQIIGAMLQRMTYREFLPEVLGPAIMRKFNLNLLERGRSRYNSRTDASIVTEFSTAAFRFGHSLVRQTYATSSTNQIDLREIFDSFKTVNTYSATSLLNGMTTDAMQSFDRFLTIGLRDELFGQQLDLAALNIQRSRDHGVASYNDVRRALGLRVHTTYNTMIGVTHSMETINRLKLVYPTPADIELFPGGVSELSTSGAIVGETFGNIIGWQFQRIKEGDRFWHEGSERFVSLTDDQLKEIRKASFAALYCNNVPNAVVRRFLLLKENSVSNPRVSCSSIPRVDISKFRIGGPRGSRFSREEERTEDAEERAINSFRAANSARERTLN